MTLGSWVRRMRLEMADKFGDAVSTELVVSWLYDGMIEAYTLRPDCFVVSAAVTLVPGALQKFPCASKALRLVQTVSGVELVRSMVIDEAAAERFGKPFCVAANASDPCANWVLMATRPGTAPGQIIVYPPVPFGCETATANLYAPVPPAPFDSTKLDAPACVPLEFWNAVPEWFQYKDYSAKRGSEGARAAAQQHFTNFVTLIKGATQADGSLALGGLPDGFGTPRPPQAIYERLSGGAR